MRRLVAACPLAVAASAPAQFLSIAENAAVLYDAPSRQAKPLYVVSKHYPVEVIVNLDAWVKVRDHTGAQWRSMLSAAGLAPEELGRFTIHQEFDAWVARMNTSPGAVTGLRALCDEAPAEVRAPFGIAAHGSYDFDLELVLIRARKR